jgi:hypothetical protein
MNFSSLRLTPSISRLVLLGKDLIRSEICMGPVLPSSKGGVSLVGMKDSGVTEVGRTFSEMDLPALEKKALNSLAISVGSEIVLLGVVIPEILADLLLVFDVNSLRVSQVFLGFFAYWRNFSS